MAITWDVQITPLNVARKEASVYAMRTDDATSEVQNFHIATCILATTQQKVDILNQLWQMHLDYEANQTAIDAYLSGLEATAKANLEARET